MKNIEYNLFHKTDKFREEKEYRAFYIADDFNDDSKIYYPDDTLASITFGYKIKPEHREKIIDTIKNNYTNYSQIHFYEAIETSDKRVIIKPLS